MPLTAFFKNYVQIFKAAQLCLDQDLHMPSLILTFTLIDSFAWASSAKTKRQSRTQFEAWLNQWVYPFTSLPCTATELYAARCGILHTLTSKADLNTTASVRQLAFAWGPARLETLQNSIKAIGRPEIVGVHINELLQAIRGGMERTFEAAERDSALLNRLEIAASLHFAQLPKTNLERLMELHEKKTRKETL